MAGAKGEATARNAWPLALLLVAADLVAYWFLPPSTHYAWRLLAAVAIVYALVLTRAATPETLGLGRGGLRDDILFSLKVGLAVCAGAAAVGIVALAAIRLGGWRPPVPASQFRSQDEYYPFLLHACVMAPIVEELIYRGLFVGLSTSGGSGGRAAIGASAAIFPVLHIVYARGPIDPVACAQYVVAGGLLAWAFLKRRSLLPAVLLHALGNLAVGAQGLVLLWWPREIRTFIGY